MISSLYPMEESKTDAEDGFVENIKGMTINDALTIVKEYMKNITPYRCEYDRYGNTVGAVMDKKDEFLIGLATLVVHLVEKEDV